LADWREDPLRVIASLVALDDAIARQDRARAAYASFVGATEPLVAKQDELAPDFVRALGAVESAAAAAGLADALGGVVAAGMDAIEEGADEMTAAHITPLR
jgi:archaellum biogenesis protein FlaJ (TadC family)